MFAVIVENDQSQWSDDTGVIYHFPKRYAAMLEPGASVVYYKGKMLNKAFASSRLSPAPHYFGSAKIGSLHPDHGSTKGDLFATIEDFRPFNSAILAKLPSGAYYEQIPFNREANYWRDGVRSIDGSVYDAVLGAAGVILNRAEEVSGLMSPPGDELESALEGSPTLRYVRTYERDPRYRRQALAIHGCRCAACDVDMGEKYGELAKGLIHVHHLQPVSMYEAPRRIDPAVDLVPVCPNCHAVIHRNKNKTLTIPEVRAMLTGVS